MALESRKFRLAREQTTTPPFISGLSRRRHFRYRLLKRATSLSIGAKVMEIAVDDTADDGQAQRLFAGEADPAKFFGLSVEAAGSFSTHRVQWIRLNFDQHPLMRLPRLAELAHDLMASEQCRFIRPSTTQSSEFFHTSEVPDKRAINEVLERNDEPGSWIALYNVQSDPLYAAFLHEVLASARPLVEAEQPGILRIRGFIFISAPRSVTPFHIDRENNFWLQTRGRKVMAVFEPDRRVAPAKEMEASIVDGSFQNVRLNASLRDRGQDFDVGPADGVCFPATSPHMTQATTDWVRPGDGVSISQWEWFFTRTSHATRRGRTRLIAYFASLASHQPFQARALGSTPSMPHWRERSRQHVPGATLRGSTGRILIKSAPSIGLANAAPCNHLHRRILDLHRLNTSPSHRYHHTQSSSRYPMQRPDIIRFTRSKPIVRHENRRPACRLSFDNLPRLMARASLCPFLSWIYQSPFRVCHSGSVDGHRAIPYVHPGRHMTQGVALSTALGLTARASKALGCASQKHWPTPRRKDPRAAHIRPTAQALRDGPALLEIISLGCKKPGTIFIINRVRRSTEE